MRLRITQTQQGPTTVLHVDGWLVGTGVAELEWLCRAASPPLTLDLSNLRTVDAAGSRTLGALADTGVQMVGASPYIVLLLERHRKQ